MRETKFRGIINEPFNDSYYRGFVYGNFMRGALNNDALIQHKRKDDSLTTSIVYEETVSEYTGLKDKNSVEIYEGDIVKVGVFKYEVEYVLCCYGISTKNGFKILSDISTSIPSGDTSICKVIGNIYEDKELLHD